MSHSSETDESRLRSSSIMTVSPNLILCRFQVAVLQPFLKQAALSRSKWRQGPEQDQPRATASYADACSKLDEAVALVDTLGCEVVLKEVGGVLARPL